jgi:hypothetical protein
MGWGYVMDHSYWAPGSNLNSQIKYGWLDVNELAMYRDDSSRGSFTTVLRYCEAQVHLCSSAPVSRIHHGLPLRTLLAYYVCCATVMISRVSTSRMRPMWLS